MDTVQGLPRLNEPAPDFEVKTTHGKRKLGDYKGKWLILFSHPGDFTPVCTTEFIAFAKAYPEFQKRNCDLLGLSIDSTFSHIAWVRNIKQNFEVDIPFPIIDDVSMKVAHAYGKRNKYAVPFRCSDKSFYPNNGKERRTYRPLDRETNKVDKLLSTAT